ncbi:MAG: hypothetical protein PHE53_07080 [Thermoguttaceae bacterium]|nr:hypothetical protein [Thermoguttaceae bacterium]
MNTPWNLKKNAADLPDTWIAADDILCGLTLNAYIRKSPLGATSNHGSILMGR